MIIETTQNPEGFIRVIDAMTASADAFAAEAHAGQTRWNNGEPYINHPRQVAAAVPPHLRPAALMHDVLEDGAEPDQLLVRMQKAFPSSVWMVVQTLTRKKDESYSAYIARVGQDANASVIKLADLAHNLRDLKPGPRRDKYELAQLYLTQSHAPAATPS